MKMTSTRRMVGVALVMLLALGTGWVVEKTIRGSYSHGRATTGEPAKPDDVRPAATDQEYDRSDLLLSQG